MKLSMARVSVSSCSPHTSSRIDLRETTRPSIPNEMAEQFRFHQSQLDGVSVDPQLQLSEIDGPAVE